MSVQYEEIARANTRRWHLLANYRPVFILYNKLEIRSETARKDIKRNANTVEIVIMHMCIMTISTAQLTSPDTEAQPGSQKKTL